MEQTLDLATITVREFVESMGGFDLTDDGLWTGMTLREYISVSVQGRIGGHAGNHYFIATSMDAPNPQELRFNTANFESFRAELIRLLNLPDDKLKEWATYDDEDE